MTASKVYLALLVLASSLITAHSYWHTLHVAITPTTPCTLSIRMIEYGMNASIYEDHRSLTDTVEMDIDYKSIEPQGTLLITIDEPSNGLSINESIFLTKDVESVADLPPYLSIKVTKTCQKFAYGPLCGRRCEHNAHYDNVVDGMMKCKQGWSGACCMKRVCPSCKNGRCTREGKCMCTRGWMGANCDEPDYCRNGGETVVRNNIRACECVGGWTGERCEVFPSTSSPTTITDTSSYNDFAVCQLKLAIVILIVMLAVLILFIVFFLRYLRQVSRTVEAVIQEGRDVEEHIKAFKKEEDIFKISIEENTVDYCRYGPAPAFLFRQPPPYMEKAIEV